MITLLAPLVLALSVEPLAVTAPVAEPGFAHAPVLDPVLAHPEGSVTGVVTLEGAPVSGATVVFEGKRGKSIAATETDAQGRFDLSVPRRWSELVVRADGAGARWYSRYELWKRKTWEPGDLASASTVPNVRGLELDVVLQPGADVAGKLVRSDGSPCRGHTLMLHTDERNYELWNDLGMVGWPRRVDTNGSGSFAFEGVPLGMAPVLFVLDEEGEPVGRYLIPADYGTGPVEIVTPVRLDLEVHVDPGPNEPSVLDGLQLSAEPYDVLEEDVEATLEGDWVTFPNVPVGAYYRMSMAMSLIEWADLRAQLLVSEDGEAELVLPDLASLDTNPFRGHQRPGPADSTLRVRYSAAPELVEARGDDPWSLHFAGRAADGSMITFGCDSGARGRIADLARPRVAEYRYGGGLPTALHVWWRGEWRELGELDTDGSVELVLPFSNPEGHSRVTFRPEVVAGPDPGFERFGVAYVEGGPVSWLASGGTPDVSVDLTPGEYVHYGLVGARWSVGAFSVGESDLELSVPFHPPGAVEWRVDPELLQGAARQATLQLAPVLANFEESPLEFDVDPGGSAISAVAPPGRYTASLLVPTSLETRRYRVLAKTFDVGAGERVAVAFQPASGMEQDMGLLSVTKNKGHAGAWLQDAAGSTVFRGLLKWDAMELELPPGEYALRVWQVAVDIVVLDGAQEFFRSSSAPGEPLSVRIEAGETTRVATGF